MFYRLTMTSRPLPEPDRKLAKAFWERYLLASGEQATCSDIACFGDSPEMADELIELVLAGTKRATAGSVLEYRAEGAPLPTAGDRWVACDGRGRPRAVLHTTEATIAPLSCVDAAFAWDEGEGDRSLDWWLQAHTSYFRRRFADIGETFHREIEVCFERFEVVFDEQSGQD